jgi:hypothetical protein
VSSNCRKAVTRFCHSVAGETARRRARIAGVRKAGRLLSDGKCEEAKMGSEACAASWDWEVGAGRKSAGGEVANADESGLVVETSSGEVLGAESFTREADKREELSGEGDKFVLVICGTLFP